MKNYNTILTEKQQGLQSGKVDKYEYLIGEGILPSEQSRIIEQTKFTYFAVGKVFKNQIKTIAELGKNKLKLQKF